MKKLVLMAVLSFIFIGTVPYFPPEPYPVTVVQNSDVEPGH
ncbi:hypothetical protein [Paenibacillus ehimensis]|nr:hypothetical protein [Paenibacillus ehimensis]MEC0208686.1 hypothetical protein [Paenibacillus ehimensis]